MGVLTVANQLTFLRILLIPAFVLLVTYAYLGWALLVFLTAGVTDSVDYAIRKGDFVQGVLRSLGAESTRSSVAI